MYDLEKMQKCQLSILKEFVRVCEKKNLQYCLAYGTCLGAVRHRGFIPWDDDIDVFMPIEDFEKLKLVYYEFTEPYFLQCHETDSEYGLMITRIRKSDTTLIEKSEVQRSINHGVFVDIYPLFNCPKYGIEFRKMLTASMVYRLLAYEVAPQNRGLILKIGSKILLSVIGKKSRVKLKKRLYNFLISQRKTGYVSSLYGNDSSIIYKFDWFFPPKEAEFEKDEFNIPRKANKFLKFRYGDFMKLPPEDQRKVHHEYTFVDLDNSYIRYKGKYFGIS